jgi:hypothetical protein
MNINRHTGNSNDNNRTPPARINRQDPPAPIRRQASRRLSETEVEQTTNDNNRTPPTDTSSTQLFFQNASTPFINRLIRHQNLLERFNREASIPHDVADEILQRFHDTHVSLGLPEGAYLEFAHDMGRMHENRIMTANNVMHSLRRLLTNPNETQSRFITECEAILRPRER